MNVFSDYRLRVQCQYCANHHSANRCPSCGAPHDVRSNLRASTPPPPVSAAPASASTPKSQIFSILSWPFRFLAALLGLVRSVVVLIVVVAGHWVLIVGGLILLLVLQEHWIDWIPDWLFRLIS